jgi:hypothetical protein
MRQRVFERRIVQHIVVRTAGRAAFIVAVLGYSVAVGAQPPTSTPAVAAPPDSGGTIAAPVPPFPNRANDLLPSWLRVRAEFRERFEGFSASGFAAGQDDAYWLSRFRFNMSVTPSRLFAFTVQAQDARVANKTVGPSATPFRAPLDLRLAFADIGTTQTTVSVRAGRQELVYGDQRLVGHANWLNAARTFDGAKVTWRTKAVTLDVFGVSVVRILEQSFDTSGNGNRFVGAYATAGTLVPKASVEPFVFWREDHALKNEAGTLADLHQATIGVRWVGQLPARLDYNTEMAGQTGSLGSDTIGAWAGHWQIRESYKGPRAVRVSAEVNLASGDASPTDGKRGTFDQLYPTGHDKYGLADQIGWRNIRHVRTGVEFAPRKRWTLGAHYHSWWLMDSHDALYNAGGAVVARLPAGATSTHVGQELDAQLSLPLTPQLALSTGVAHIFPGAFLKQTTPGAADTAPFVMATYVFLADR